MAPAFPLIASAIAAVCSQTEPHAAPGLAEAGGYVRRSARRSKRESGELHATRSRDHGRRKRQIVEVAPEQVPVVGGLDLTEAGPEKSEVRRPGEPGDD